MERKGRAGDGRLVTRLVLVFTPNIHGLMFGTARSYTVGDRV